MKKIILLPLLAIIIFISCSNDSSDDQIDPIVETPVDKEKEPEEPVQTCKITEKDNFIILRADVENEELIFKNNLNYNFVALKKSVSGNYSTNRQSGEFSLKPQERTSVSEIRLNIDLKFNYLFNC